MPGRTHRLSPLPDPNRRWVLSLIMLGSLIVTAAIDAAPPPRVACGTCEDSDRFVRLLQAPSTTRPHSLSGFTHPFPSSPEEWRALLKTINIRTLETGWFPFSISRAAALPGFAPDDIDYLSATLPRAFAEARSDEWVVFGLSRRPVQEIPELTEFTTGAWFAQDGQVHLVLANHREAVTLPAIRALLRDNPLHVLGGLRIEFVPGPGQQAGVERDGLRELLAAAPPELVLAYPTRQVDRVVQSDQSGVSETARPSIPFSPPLPSLEERLRLLERLKDQGLISEEEYKTKRRALLDRL